MEYVPVDWPSRVGRAARGRSTAERAVIAAELLALLKRTDPMNLRARGLDATRRQAVYAQQIDAQLRAVA